jgi:hypothetical protein
MKPLSETTKQAIAPKRALGASQFTLLAGATALIGALLCVYTARPADAALTSNVDAIIDSTGTDNYVNAFIKNQYAMGFKNVMAAGSWWGM